jgi:hypothetical protein
MAHHVAELMERADNGDGDAAREASQLILDLWSRRSDWPEGWPPRRSAYAIERLAEAAEPIESQFPPDDREQEDGEDPWLMRLGTIARLLGDELAVWRRLALVGLDVDVDMAKAEAAKSELSEDELGILRGLVIHYDSAIRHFERASEGDQSDSSPIDLSRRELEELNRSRWALFDAAAAAALGARNGDDGPDEHAD